MNHDDAVYMQNELSIARSHERALQRLVNDIRDALALMTTRAKQAEATVERVWDYVQGIDGEEGVFTVQGHLTNVIENFKMPKEQP
jgi:hypothetical protein